MDNIATRDYSNENVGILEGVTDQTDENGEPSTTDDADTIKDGGVTLDNRTQDVATDLTKTPEVVTDTNNEGSN